MSGSQTGSRVLFSKEMGICCYISGRFRWPRNKQEAMRITQEQFDWLMKGMTIVSTPK